MSTLLKEINVCNKCKKEAHCIDKYSVLWCAKCLLNQQKMSATKKKLPTYEGEKIVTKIN